MLRKTVLLLVTLAAGTAPVHAVTPAQADSALAALNTVYWNETGKHFYKTDKPAGRLDFWMSAHAWETVMEAWKRTGKDGYRKQITDMYDGFVKYFGTDWSQNDYNDDILWWTLACTQVYEATGEKRYLDQAKKYFDWVYSTQVDTVFGGGIWWRNDEHKTKNSCVVQPGILTAFHLSRLLNDPSYKAKAEALYAWQKKTLTETSGKVYDAINFSGLQKGSTTYNQGTFIGSAQVLDHIADAEKCADWTRANLCDAQGVIRNNTQGDFGTFAQILVRYAVKLGRRPGGEKYIAWMEANAEAAWKNRRKRDHIMGPNWVAAPPDTGIQSQVAVGGAALLNLLATPIQTRIAPARGAESLVAAPALRFTGSGLPVLSVRGRTLSLDGRYRP